MRPVRPDFWKYRKLGAASFTKVIASTGIKPK